MNCKEIAQHNLPKRSASSSRKNSNRVI